MARKTDKQKIEEIEKKEKEFSEKKMALKKKIEEKEKEKAIRLYCANEKKRTKTARLNKIGQIVEDVLGDELTQADDLENLENFLKSQEKRGNFFSAAMKRIH